MRGVCLVVLLTVVLVWTVSAQTLFTDPYPLEIAVEEEGSIDLILDSAPDGLKAYAIVLSVDENVDITGITLPDWCQFTAVEEKDYGWYVQCLDTNNEITSGATEVVLATINVSGVVAGSSDLFIQTVGTTPDGWVLGIYDDNAQPMFDENVTVDGAVRVMQISISDLTVVGIEVEGTPIVNEVATVDVTIANVGDGDAEGFNVSLYADGELVGVKTVESLVAGGEVTLEFEWTPSEAKTYELRAVVDPDNVVDESNETNNIMTVTVEVLEPANVFVEDFSVNVTEGIVPLVVEINATVVNTGDLAGEITVHFYIDGSEVYSETIEVAGGSVEYVTYIHTFTTSGTYNISVNNLPPKQIEVQAQEPWQWYDENHNGKIEDQELIDAIMDWIDYQITDEQLINVILKWLENT